MSIFGKKYCKKGHKMDPSWDVCPVCITPIQGWLVHFEEGLVNSVFEIHLGKNILGSGEDCEIRLLFDSIKRNHAIISAGDNICKIISQGGEGRLRVNNIDITNTELIDGDLISIGMKEFKYKSI